MSSRPDPQSIAIASASFLSTRRLANSKSMPVSRAKAIKSITVNGAARVIVPRTSDPDYKTFQAALAKCSTRLGTYVGRDLKSWGPATMKSFAP